MKISCYTAPTRRCRFKRHPHGQGLSGGGGDVLHDFSNFSLADMLSKTVWVPGIIA